jgi:hypothetical protein
MIGDAPHAEIADGNQHGQYEQTAQHGVGKKGVGHEKLPVKLHRIITANSVPAAIGVANAKLPANMGRYMVEIKTLFIFM